MRSPSTTDNMAGMAVAYKWTAIVLTCQDKHSAHAFHTELELRQQKGQIGEDTILLTVEDPKAAVGSGGATLNALLVVCEHISAKQGYTVVNADVLEDAHILILHMGRNFLCDPCGRAFVTLPMCHDQDVSLITNLDLLLDNVSNKLAQGSPPGVWVCSTDMLLNIPADTEPLDWEGVDVCAITVPGDPEYATLHGVYKINNQGYVGDIFYQGEIQDVNQCMLENGKVPLVSGVEYFSCDVSERMLTLIVMPPLDACTYMGLDSGQPPIQLSVFFDFMLGMCDGLLEEAFVSGERSGYFGKAMMDTVGPDEAVTIHNARRRIWKELHPFRIKARLLPDGCHSYMSLLPKQHISHMTECPIQPLPGKHISNRVHSFAKRESDISTDSVMINSLTEESVKVGQGSVLCHTHLSQGFTVGKGCYVAGLLPRDFKTTELSIGDHVMLQTFHVHLPTLDDHVPQRVFTIWGVNDNLQLPVSSDKATFCGMKWRTFQEMSGIYNEDLWESHTAEGKKNLLSAKLFPVFCATKSVGLADYLWLQNPSTQDHASRTILERWRSSWRLSLEEILYFVNIAEEFSHRRQLFYLIGQCKVRDVLLNQQDTGLYTLYTSAVVDGFASSLLDTLDSVAQECGSPGVAARTMANIADVLGAMSRGRGGLRSGPAGNRQWATAFALLEEGAIFEGIEALRAVRHKWVGRPDHQVRAARHYEGAAQILIRHAVMTGRKFITTSRCEPPAMGQWVTVRCPARLEFAGGWSDTPPITYEHGGAVINGAITFDGKKPIGAKTKRIPEPQLVLVMHGEVTDDTRMVITKLSQLSDYSHPHAPGALLKAAFICAEIIEHPSTVSLHDQLLYKYGGGFEIFSWSHMPHGSGLGTSSILAGAVMAALWRASGKKFDLSSLIHAVLHLEQMLTTGGGWQDQIGGLCPGVKVGHSPAKLPLKIDVSFPDISTQTIRDFNDRLALVYTGKTRLAKNLLQSVIRNWYARNPDILQTEDELVALAWDCASAFEEGDLEKVGECINTFQRHKKTMAPGSEPVAISRMMQALEPHVWGVSLAGAGGGGFIFFLTKEPNAIKVVGRVLSGLPGTENMTFHRAEIDTTGLVMEVEGVGHESVKMKL